ncbi:MAG: mechanosensitive ion channel [Deltaproteobacteria bacterium]|nr:mechanosensitive ion channel [Deltaproteobacteria bacterium]
MNKRPRSRYLLTTFAIFIFLLAHLLLPPSSLSRDFALQNVAEGYVGETFFSLKNQIFFPEKGIFAQQESPDLFEIIAKKLTTFQKIWNFEFFSIGKNPVTASKVVVAMLSLVLGIIIVKMVMGTFEKRVLPRTRLKPNVAASIQKILYYLGILLVVLFALHLVNIPLTAFAFVGGALAIGVGFGAQTLINNFISGFIIMAEQPIRIGDLIEIEGMFATIEDIGARCTRIRTGENIQILVPNSSFLEKNIVNWTLSDSMVRACVTVGVVYGSPVKEAASIMVTIAKEHEKVLPDPQPFIRFSDFGDNALIFNIYFWINMNSLSDRLNIESDIRFQIDDRFREADIVIAFPQRDVHLDAVKPLELKILDSRHKEDNDKSEE